MLTSAVSIIGLGVDLQRSYSLKSSLQTAVDAAAISGALAKSGLDDEASFGERRKAAILSFNDNIGDMDVSQAPNVDINPTSSVISVEATAKTDYLIMSLFGHKNKTIYAQGKAAYGENFSDNAVPTLDDDPSNNTQLPTDTNEITPLSIAFVLDNSTSILEDFSGKRNSKGNARGRGGLNPNGAINVNAPNGATSSKLDLIKGAAQSYYDTLNDLAQLNPAIRQNIRTALMPYNDGVDNRYKVGLVPGWQRTAAQTRNMKPDRHTLPVEAFDTAAQQLNGDRKTEESKARKVIVFVGDGDFDPGFEARTETQRFVESCQRAKTTGVEIYVLALEVPAGDSLTPYQLCASPNGSRTGYAAAQIAIDTSCTTALSERERQACQASKSTYFSHVTSELDLQDFWAKLNPEIAANTGQTPPETDPSAQATLPATPPENQPQEARIRLVK